MKKTIVGTALVICTTLLACNNSDTAEVDKSIIPDSTSQTGVTSIVPDSTQGIQAINTTPSTVNPGPALTAAPAKTPAIGGSSAPNPAHGQPGHRCDIAVGAPLNSAATIPTQAKTSQPITATPAMPAPAASVPVSTDPNAKLNPAHGQPGHDCSIAVGAPLKKN